MMADIEADLTSIIEHQLTPGLGDREIAKMLLSELDQRGWRFVQRVDLNHAIAKGRHSSRCPKYVPETDEYACTCHVARLKAALQSG